MDRPSRWLTIVTTVCLLIGVSGTSNIATYADAQATTSAASWKAGEVYTDYDKGPWYPHVVGITSQGVFFPSLGLCDEFGYTVKTSQFNWPIQKSIQSLFATNLNGCDSVTLVRTDGARWSCSTSCMRNAPIPWLIQIGGGFQKAGLAKIIFWGHNRVIASVPQNDPRRQATVK